jgi:hypothetical protein
MLSTAIDTLQLASGQHDGTDSGEPSPEKDGYWVYTPDGYMFVSTRKARHETVNSFGLTLAFDETCF